MSGSIEGQSADGGCSSRPRRSRQLTANHEVRRHSSARIFANVVDADFLELAIAKLAYNRATLEAHEATARQPCCLSWQIDFEHLP